MLSPEKYMLGTGIYHTIYVCFHSLARNLDPIFWNRVNDCILWRMDFVDCLSCSMYFVLTFLSSFRQSMSKLHLSHKLVLCCNPCQGKFMKYMVTCHI